MKEKSISSGKAYRDLIAAYVAHNYADRGIEVYTEIPFGKSIIAKDRKVDVLVLTKKTAFAIECKTQTSQGTADEKLVYSLQDLGAMGIPGAIVYAGEGFSPGIVQMLRAHPSAAYCDPDPRTLERDKTRTLELDVLLAQAFSWWDMFKIPARLFSLDEWLAQRDESGD